MQEVWNFIVNNWQVIATILVNVVSFVVLLIVKRVKITDPVIVALVQELPGYINTAEASGKSGADKFALVINLALNYLSVATGLDKEATFNKYYLIVENLIEGMLSTPQKKEATNEK